MPLYVQNGNLLNKTGTLGTSVGCCCSPPPPERCWCGSFCSYSISVVEPLQATARGYICNAGFDSDTTTVNPSLLDAITGAEPPGFGGVSFSRAIAYSSPGEMIADVLCSSFGISPDFSYSDIYATELRAQRQAQVLVFCTLEEGQPKFYASISLSVTVRFDVTFNPISDWTRTYMGTFEIPSTCVVSPEKECEPELVGNVEFRRIDTPLEITLSGDGTSSLGSLTMTNDSGTAGDAEGLVDTILEATSYTFRITARENCLPLCPCNCNGSGFDFCDGSQTIDFSYNLDCNGNVSINQYDVPCLNLVFAEFEDLLLYFGTAAQGYPFSRQWMKDEAVATYANETCSFAIHACQKVRVSSSRCMRGDECICINASVTVSNNWYVQFFDCALEQWIDITSDILTESREVFFSPGQALGPANNCGDCEFDNGNPPAPPADPGPCDYDITAGECENITGNFP